VKRETNIRTRLSAVGPGLAAAALIGILAYVLKAVWRSPVADPLVIAMVAGVIIRTGVGRRTAFLSGFTAAPRICIPAGIAFYAFRNLNFVQFAEVRPTSIVLGALIVSVYFATILVLGRLLRQKDRISYLTATGSGICGASAIAVASPALDADSDDISVSLLAVTAAAVVALFTILPFVATTFRMTDRTYGLLSGSVLQITGFVKAAVASLPFLTRQLSDNELVSLALSVKAARYLGLMIAIPLFASLIQKRFYIPWVLWLFVGAGILGTWVCAAHRQFYVTTLIPVVKPIYGISWSIAMAAIGLNADVRQLLSNNGAKALIMAFAGCVAAIMTFFIGSMILG
jgi:uncharacterized integral membrane protein (TIGR00698 family)